MKWRKRIVSAIAVALSVIMFSSNVVYATEGMDINNAEQNSVVEDVNLETETVIEEQVVLEDNVENEVSVESVSEENSEEKLSVSENIVLEETEVLETTSESEEVVEELPTEESTEEIIEEVEEEVEVETVLLMENPYVWTSDNFQISHNIVKDWGTGYQCEITITNIGDNKIEDWKLVLETTDTIDNIWNAAIALSEAEVYHIDNLGWNGNILSGGSVSFGYVASNEEAPCIPTFYGVSGAESELTEGAYQVTYQVSDLWENGYVGNIVIHNLTDSDLRNWKITFDLSDDIVNLWNGNITGNENGKYIVEYASYNATIPAGGNVIIGFTAEAESPQVYPENYSIKVVVHNEMDISMRDDVIGIAYFEPITEADIRIAEDGIQYAVNQLNIVGEEGTTFEQIASLGEEYGFEIVGYIEFTNDYQIKFVNEKTYEELRELCSVLEQLNYICETNLNLASRIVNNQAEDEYIIHNEDAGIAYPSTGKWALNWTGDIVNSSNWGMRAINAPQAWAYYEQMSTVKIGAIDFSFGPHDELEYKEIWNYVDYGTNYEEWDNHGTLIAGVMAAKWQDGTGIVGVSYDEELYAYAYLNAGNAEEYYMLTTMEEKYALALLIGNGVRVINSSVGFQETVVYGASQGNRKAINYVTEFAEVVETFLMRLIERGYDFVIVQAAGNDNAKYFVKDFSTYGWRLLQADEYGANVMKRAEIGNVDAQYVFCFSCMQNIKDRIIVVGAYGIDDSNNIAMCDFSNTGTAVSVVAPGNKIYGTVPGNEFNDGKGRGTSLAAPFVSGIAALVYSVNPELSGSQVKEIIVDSATKTLSGIAAYQETKSGFGLMVPADGQVYKCADAGAAVERALQEKGDTPILGENTGFIMGNIVREILIGDTTKAAEGVEISAYRYSTYDGNVDTNYQYTTVSDEEGFFELCVDPGMYQVTIYKKGYIPLIIENVQVLEGKVNYLEQVLQIQELSFQANYEITGNVVDALNATPIGDADILFRKGWNETEAEILDETAVTDEDGTYTVTLKRGYDTAEISKEGYVTGYVNIVVYEDMTIQKAVLSPYLQENEMRIVLTWGENRSDLDSHMYITGGYTNHHIYFGKKTVYDGNGNVICKLDRDTIGYGPETITLYLSDDTENCKYSVYRYSSSGSLLLSGAKVVVYYGSNPPITYNVPVQEDGRTWDVFEIENGEIVPINSMY